MEDRLMIGAQSLADYCKMSYYAFNEYMSILDKARYVLHRHPATGCKWIKHVCAFESQMKLFMYAIGRWPKPDLGKPTLVIGWDNIQAALHVGNSKMNEYKRQMLKRNLILNVAIRDLSGRTVQVPATFDCIVKVFLIEVEGGRPRRNNIEANTMKWMYDDRRADMYAKRAAKRAAQ